MKQGRTLTDLAVELERQLETKRDVVTSTSRMQFTATPIGERTDPLVQIAIDDTAEDGGIGTWPVETHAHHQIGERVKIPRRYYDRMMSDAPDLLATNVNHWWHQHPERRMVRLLDGRARAFLSNAYHRIDNYDVADITLHTLADAGTEMQVVSCQITAAHLYIKACFPEVTAPLVGDVVTAGIMAKNSEIGLGRFEVVPYIVIRSCTNGMVRTEFGESRVHLGTRLTEDELGVVEYRDDTKKAIDTALMLKVRDVVRSVATKVQFERLVEDLRELTDFRVDSPPDSTVEILSKRHDLSDREQTGVLTHLVEGGDLSAWGYIQAVTRTAEDVESYDRATELETLGGKLASKTEWRKISEVARQLLVTA